MPRLYLFAEGQTEQSFADTVLKPHLANHGVYMHNPVLIAHARKKRRIHRGGGRNFVAMQNDITKFLRQERGDDVFFTTMIDLYALHPGFPGIEEAENLRSGPYHRVEFLETAWHETTDDRRFVPFIQLHEFEAYLFANIQELDFAYDESQAKIETLKQIANGVESPELIDDGQHTAPSKRIIVQFPDYEYAKSTVGPLVAERVGLNSIREKCPHFDAWITRLEGLGRQSS
jgi:hypothetical protein